MDCNKSTICCMDFNHNGEQWKIDYTTLFSNYKPFSICIYSAKTGRPRYTILVTDVSEKLFRYIKNKIRLSRELELELCLYNRALLPIVKSTYK